MRCIILLVVVTIAVLLPSCGETTLRPSYSGILLCDNGDPLHSTGKSTLTLIYAEEGHWLGAAEPYDAELVLTDSETNTKNQVNELQMHWTSSQLMLSGTIKVKGKEHGLEMEGIPDGPARYDFEACFAATSGNEGPPADGGTPEATRCASTCSGALVIP